MQDLIYALFLGVVILFSLYLKIKPNYLGRAGVDHWFWLLYIRAFNKKKEFPVKLDNYLLEIDEQWYPPLLPIIVSRIGEGRMNLVAPIVDFLHSLLLISFTYLFTHDMFITLIAGLVYSFTPITITYNFQLNPRGLGSLFLSIVFLSVIFAELTGSYYVLLFAIIFGCLILLTHKMTAQMMAVFLFCYSLITWNFTYVGLLPLIVVCTIVFSKGFYLKVLKGHYDIVAFWKRNMDYLWAHQVKESPLYRKDKVQVEEKKQASLSSRIIEFSRQRTPFVKLAKIFTKNPFILVAVPLLMAPEMLSLDGLPGHFFAWAVLTYLWVLATTYVRPLRCLGEGHLYTYCAVFPLSFLAGILVSRSLGGALPLLFLSLLLSGLIIYLFFQTIRGGMRSGVVDRDFAEITQVIGTLPKDMVMCIPTALAEYVTYETGKKVLWGAHSYGFRELEPFWPVLRKSIAYFIHEYGINYILVDEDYVKLEDFIVDRGMIDLCGVRGRYRLYCVKSP